MTLREECIEAAAMAMWDSDYPEASENTRREAWLNHNLSYVGHATAAFDAILERMRANECVYRHDGEVVHELRGAPNDIWQAMLAPLTQSGT